MRMARVNVYLPDDLHRDAKAAHLNVSELCQAAVREELGLRSRVEAMEHHLRQIEEAFGPASETEVAAAEAWADSVLGASRPSARRKAPGRRTRRETA